MGHILISLIQLASEEDRKLVGYQPEMIVESVAFLQIIFYYVL